MTMSIGGNLAIMELQDILPIRPILIDTLDIHTLLNVTEISTESQVIFDVANSITFRELAKRTNLNVPPKNWLNPSVNIPSPLNIKQKVEESESFYIANMFPECNNKAKIVADAEVIKQLLKIPYSKKSVSLMVRKIGNILLIDNFDIENFSGNEGTTEENKLSQIEEFITKLKELNTNLSEADHSSKKLRQRNMFSKFLFRSVVNDTVVNKASAEEEKKASPVYKFGRIIYWKFEETQMLIGTKTLKQLLYLKNKATRCVSLHVSNAGEPLKIENAIDMWLDNLMCDIPEAVICSQLAGIVKDYKCVQTQNIPHLMGSQFALTKMKSSAKRIFSFLLNQKFQRSQIYWLLKCKNANDFKFFNLNILEATDGQIQIIKTPFDFECGKLFYRFGHYQYYSNTQIERKEWSITMLLEDSIRSLNRNLHPEIIATANYLIVHLSFSYDNIFKTTLFVKSKVEFQNCKKQPESVTNRCFDALKNISDGLRCLEYFSTNTEGTILKKNRKPQNSFDFNFKLKKMKKQDEVIHINISSLFPKKEYQILEAFPDWQNINEDRDYWKNYLKLLFYQKAELIFGILAQQYFYCDMFGLCLRSLSMMVRSNKIKIKIDPSSHSIAINPVLIIAGDCCQSISTVDVSKNSMETSNDDSILRNMINIFITDELYYEINTNINYGLQENLMNCTKIELMEKAIEFYKKSLEYEEMDFIRKKLFVSNLALSKLYSDQLYKIRKETNRFNYFEQSEKYIIEAFYDIARSPLDQASALFHRGELHDLLCNIYLEHPVTSSSVKNNLYVHSKVFLESFKDALRILNTYKGDNEDCIKETNKHLGDFICCMVTRLFAWKFDQKSQITKNLLKLMYDCFVSGSKDILDECELSHQRYKDDFLFLVACAVMKWFIGSCLIQMEKIGFRSANDNIKDSMHAALTSFSDLSVWKYYILALHENSIYLVGKALREDQFNVPLNQKIENVKDALKMFCQAGRDFQKIMHDNFIDKFSLTLINNPDEDDELFDTVIPQFQIQIKYLLVRGIDLSTYLEEEMRNFKICLRIFQGEINGDFDIKLFLTALIGKLDAMCITMKFDI